MLLRIALLVPQLLSLVTATTCPSGYTVSGGIETCYQWHSTPEKWNNARNICSRNNGDLVSLNRRDKFSDFRSIAKAKGSRAWVGAHMPGSTWNWVNGQALAFGWAPDEPNSGAEDCVELYNDKDYYLNDDECYERHPFICETPACKPIEHCLSLGCTSGMPSPSYCSRCVDNKYFFKTTSGGTKCERMCAWNNHYCWPGHCSDDLTKNCVCSQGFNTVLTSSETSCQPIKSPSFETCATKAVGPNGEMKISKTHGPTTECIYQSHFYGRFQPVELQYRLLAQFKVDTSAFPSKPSYIDSYNFGVTDVTLETVLQSIAGNQQLVTNIAITSVHSPSTVKEVESNDGTIPLQNRTLSNGESLCLKYIAYGGGFLISVDTSQSSRPLSKPKPYLKTSTTKTICYRYDNSTPEHCLEKGTCSSGPLELQTRVSTTPNIRVTWQGWTDPVPNGGQLIHASSIESYQITVNEVSGPKDSLRVSTDVKFTKKVSANVNHLTLNLTSNRPKLYCVTLEVKDVADNVRQARRFVLFDNTTFITSRWDKPFYVYSGSVGTNYTWQTHHNDICLKWEDHFYNQFYLDNPLLSRIEPAPLGLISGVYEQRTGRLPVSGTPNVYGITKFMFSFALENATFSTDSAVPNFEQQRICKSLPVKDGDTYRLKIRAVDIASHTFSEERLVFIDRSVPHIENIELVKDGYKKLFVHDQVDLSKMILQFEAYDPHSGIEKVEWFFGISDYSGDLDSGAIGVTRIDRNNCSLIMQCYCPKVGDHCETLLYIVNLNGLIQKLKNIGNHNRNYFFTIKVTNRAKLVNIEHMDVLVDDSPPETGVILEGPPNYPDIDYTSDRFFLVHWHGFIDHESGIKLYRVGLAQRCLTKNELYQRNTSLSEVVFDEISYLENTLKLLANFTGKRYVTIIALNNAMDPSEAVCSDGISRDTTTPQIQNITIANAKWSESLYCQRNMTWLLRSDLVKVQIQNSPTCRRACKYNMDLPLLNSIRSRTDTFSGNDIYALLQNVSSIENNFNAESDFLCSKFPKYDSNIIYLPNDHIVLSWDVENNISQIRDFFVGFGETASEENAPGLVGYKPTLNKKSFKIHHAGIGTDDEFFIFLKAINKAGLETIVPIGPILIDVTPPRYKIVPEVKVIGNSILVGWDNDTFFDDEQTEKISQIFFQIGHDDKTITPLLEWRQDSSIPCSRFDGGCLRYPISKLQKKDTDLGLNFYVILHIYNNAGHSLTLKTPEFGIPATYPPGQARVFDLDLEAIINANITRDRPIEVNSHLSENTVCAAWSGFKHHENLILEIGVGTAKGFDDIYMFSTINNSDYHCITSDKLPFDSKMFVSVRASCSGGSIISSSDGVIIYNRHIILRSFKVMDGPACTESKPVLITNRTITESDIMRLRLIVGQTYMLRLNGKNLSNIVSYFHQNDLHVKNINIVDYQTQLVFQPLIEDIFLHSLSNTSLGDIYLVELYNCEEDISAVVKGSSLIAHWKRHSEDFTYEAAAIQLICTNSSKDTCIKYLTPFISVTDNEVNISSVHLQEGDTYFVGVRPCLNSQCLDTVLSTGVNIEPEGIELCINEANAFTEDGNSNCLNVTVMFDLISVVNISFYQWSLSTNIGNSNTMSLIGQWKSILSDESEGSATKIQDCVQFPVYDFKDVHACVRAFTIADQKVQVCEKIRWTSRYNAIKTTLYDFDARSESWDKVKSAMHSIYLGDVLHQLHNEELDFGTEDTDVIGVILYANERNITWFLTTTKTAPVSCSNIPTCIGTLATTNGYVTFPKKLIKYNTIYYICALANESHIVRETFTEILQPIATCSNGFVIDNIPPTTGQVHVKNVNGFINDLKRLIISWNGFDDNIDVAALGYGHKINFYSVEIGSSRNGNDIKSITGIHDKTIEIVSDLHVSSGSSMFVSVIATDHAGLSTRVSSEELVVDYTPPNVGFISSDMLMSSEWISGGLLSLQLLDFNDDESGLDYFMVHIGSAPYKTDILTETIFKSDIIDLDLLSMSVLDGYVYYVGVKAVNRAGHSSEYAFIEFGLDQTPPTGGHVMDGQSSNTKDADFQTDVNHLACHWKGFTDPHSGIAYYTVGVGTETFIYDVEPRINIGLRTEVLWNSSFTPGEKYFITVEACNRASLCRSMASDGIVLDDSPPIPGLVRVGSNSYHQNFIPRNTSVQFFWTGFEDPQSGMDHFESCIGNIPGKCDVTLKFNCFLESSHIKVGLNLPENTNLYVTVTGYNKNGQNVSKTSQPFKVDSTAPTIIAKPMFFTNYSRFEMTTAQWDKSILRLNWKFEDLQSPIVRHIVTLSTHHEGHTPVEYVELGQETKLTINLDVKNWLQNGDTYKATVTACNAAGHCSSAESDDLLIDSTPPHLGGFKPPMTWQNFVNGKNQPNCKLNLTWYGFHDQESGIRKFYIGVGRTYTDNELTNGLIDIDSATNAKEHTASITLTDNLNPNEFIVASIIAENYAGLKSPIGRVTLLTLASSSNILSSDLNGILEIEKHSCDIHFCNKDCTCAVVGKVCTEVHTNVTCQNMNVTSDNTQNISVRVYGGMTHEPQYITVSSACLVGHWYVDEGEQLIKRFEWTLGIKEEPYGEGIFDLINERPWMDVGKLLYGVHCLPSNRSLEHKTEYLIYVKAWVEMDRYLIFESPPVMVDHYPPAIRRGSFVKDSDGTCKTDYDFIDWTDTIVACWAKVFNEGQGHIIYYLVGLGTQPGSDDVVVNTNVKLNTTFEATRLQLLPGHKYYFTVTAYNNVGLHTTIISDGFIVDQHPPVAGVVYNTYSYKNYGMQSGSDSLGFSWQGFLDHDSGIFSFFVAVFEVSGNDTTVLNFIDVGLQTSVILTNISLEHGQSYYGAVKAVDAANHESETVYSKRKLIDSTPPIAHRCRDKSVLYDTEFNTTDSSSVIIPAKLDANAVYLVTGSVRETTRPLTVHIIVGQTFRKIIPLEKLHDGNLIFKTSFTSKSDENRNISLMTDSVYPVAGVTTFYRCYVSPIDDTTEALNINQISPSTFRARFGVQDIESGIKRITFGVGTSVTGFQLKSPYNIDPNAEEIFTLPSSHGTPVYATATVENFAGLTTVFRSKKILVDHTPPVFGIITAKVKAGDPKRNVETVTSANETNVRLEASWNITDDESGVKICFVSVGSRAQRDNIQKSRIAIHGNRFLTDSLRVTHGTKLYANVKCINNVEYSSVKTSEPITVSFKEPDIENAAVSFIPQSVFGRLPTSSASGDRLNFQPNRTHVQFFWEGFTDLSGISFYEYRLLSDMGQLTDWVNAGKKTLASVNFASLANGQNCTAEVRAVNTGNYRSGVISNVIVINNRGPQLTGHPAQVIYNGQTATLDWENVFEVNPEIPTTFDVTVGSEEGYDDIVEKLGMATSTHTFLVPKTSIITENIQELFITITSVYSTGMKSAYKTTYKLSY